MSACGIPTGLGPAIRIQRVQPPNIKVQHEDFKQSSRHLRQLRLRRRIRAMQAGRVRREPPVRQLEF